MARADLLVQLVKSGLTGDKIKFTKVVESIIAEERAKHHKILADKLNDALSTIVRNNGSNGVSSSQPLSDNRLNGFVHETIPQKNIQDLILPSSVVQQCKDFVQEHHRVDILRSYGLEPRNRILLVGPPGNGKTSLAEGISEALMMPMMVVRYEGVVGTYLGETAVRLKKLFEFASTRKCVLFFDEFETLGKERGDVHETGEIKRVVSSLLMQIDSLPSHVIVIAATNHPELLDRAAWRRFQVRMDLPGPTQARLADWFQRYEKRLKMSLGYTPATLAKLMAGLNFAEVEEFGAAVYRHYVLGQPNSNIKEVISSTLKLWNKPNSKKKVKS